MTDFFGALFHNPRSMGAVAPSSVYLADKMTKLLRHSADQYVLELGPGTGVITQKILKMIPAQQIIALEISPSFANNLKKLFPDIRVIEGSATQLSTLLSNIKIHTVISSLPLLSLPQKDRDHILSEIPKVLVSGGQFIQYSYALHKMKSFYPKQYQLEKSFIVWRNIPPARVNVFRVYGD